MLIYQRVSHSKTFAASGSKNEFLHLGLSENRLPSLGNMSDFQTHIICWLIIYYPIKSQWDPKKTIKNGDNGIFMVIQWYLVEYTLTWPMQRGWKIPETGGLNFGEGIYLSWWILQQAMFDCQRVIFANRCFYRFMLVHMFSQVKIVNKN